MAINNKPWNQESGDLGSVVIDVSLARADLSLSGSRFPFV